MVIIQVSVFQAPLAPIFVALLLFNRAIGGVLGIQRAWQSMLNVIGSLEIVEKEFAILEERKENSGTLAIKPFSKSIEMKNVCFSYSDSTEIIKNFSLKIAANTTVAFVGESGAGKSTLG